MSSPSHHVPTRAARQDPDAPLRVDLRIPFAACAVEGFLLLGLYTLLTYLKLPRLTLLGLVFLGVYALSVGVTSRRSRGGCPAPGGTSGRRSC